MTLRGMATDGELEDIALEAPVWDAWGVGIAIVVLLALAAAVSLTVGGVLRLIGRRSPAALRLNDRIRRPLRAVLFSAAAIIAVGLLFVVTPEWTDPVENATFFVLRLALIASLGWLLAQVLLFLLDLSLIRHSADRDDDHASRRRLTQILIVRRLIIAAAVIIVVGAMLVTIPGVEAFGASLLASAGVVSVVVGIAAQSTLGNILAGLQLAFTDAVKVGDTVVVEEEYGKVEEISLSYVVVQIWDDRRLVLPSTYFTKTPFTNWTRTQTQVTGTVLLDVDWTADVAAIRAELDRVLAEAPQWDRRASGLVVLDATGARLQLRASVTARNAGELWELRCLVRERLVAFVQRERPEWLEVRRVEVAAGGNRAGGRD